LQQRQSRIGLELGAALAAALCLGGCGSSRDQRAAPPPKLPAPIAQGLAADSDAVAQALAARDACSARSAALELQQQTIAAINSNRIPAVFQERLLSSVNDLVSRIRCVPVQEEPRNKGRHKGKDKKHGEKD
jgi:hypothetical protein